MKSGLSAKFLFQKEKTLSRGLIFTIILGAISLFSLNTAVAVDPVPWAVTASVGCPGQGSYSHMTEVDGTVYFHPSSGDTFWSFDPNTETCTQLANMPAVGGGHRDLIAVDSDTILLYQYETTRENGYFDVYKISEDQWYARNEALYDDDTPIADATGTQGNGASILTDTANGDIYVLNGNSTATWQRLDPVSNTWTQLTDAPAAVGDGAALTIIGNTIYAFQGNGTDAFWSYDTVGNTWNTGLAVAPEIVGAGASLTTDGTNIYAFRGNGRRDFWRYDVGGDSWSSLAIAPSFVRAGADLVTVGTSIYAFQGNETKSFWRYDLIGNGWFENLSEAPDNVTAGGSLATDGTNIYATRGYGRGDMWTYTVGTDTWTKLENQVPYPVGSTSRAGDKGGLAYLNNTIWAITGSGVGPSTHATHDFIYRYPLTGVNANTWPTAFHPESFPEAGQRGQALVMPGVSSVDPAGDFLYALGGANLRDFWRYSVSNQAWAPSFARTLINATDTLSYQFADYFPTVQAGDGNTITKVGSEFYIAMGDGSFDGYFFKYNPTTNIWTRLADTPGAVWNGQCNMDAFETSSIYAICNFGTGLWKYDIADDYWIGPFPLATHDDGTPYDNFPVPGANIGDGQGTGSNITEVNGKLYLTRGSFQTFMEFNPASNSWTVLTGTPLTPLEGATMESIETDIYLLRAGNTGTFYHFDTLTNTWTELANFGENVFEGAAMEYPGDGDYLYAFRGANTTTFKRYCFQDTGSGCTVDTWETLATTPGGVYAGGSLAHYGNNTLYALRGNGTDNFWLYDISLNEWNPAPNGTPSGTPLTVSSGGDLVTYDNGTPGNTADDILYGVRGSNDSAFWSYDPNTDIWKYEAFAPVNISDQTGVNIEKAGLVYSPTLGDIFMTPGYASHGIDEGETVAYLYRYKLSAGPGQYTWPITKFGRDVSQVPNSANLHYGGNIAYPGSGDKLFVNSGNNNNYFMTFDEDLAEWQSHERALSLVADDTISQAGPDMGYPSIIKASNGFFYILNQVSPDLDDFYRYDPSTNEWYRLAPFPTGAPTGAPQMLENPNDANEIFAAFDTNDFNFWVYNITENRWSQLTNVPAGEIQNLTYPGSGDWIYGILGESNSYTYDLTRYSLSKDIWIRFNWARFDGDVSAGADPALIDQDMDGAYGETNYNRGVGLSITSANDKLYIQNGSASVVGKRDYFLEYDPVTNEWTDLERSPNDYGRGASLAWDGGDYLYGFTGDQSPQTFYRYCLPDAVGCTQDTWSALADAPASVNDGASLAIPPGSEYIYVLRADSSQDFWAYCMPGSVGCTGDTWTAISNTPATIGVGGSLVAVNGTTMYATRGSNTDDFYRFTIGTAPNGSWAQLANTPDNINSGGRLTYDGTYLYTAKGEGVSADAFYRYDIGGNTWSVMDSFPEPMACGGGACGGGVAYNAGTNDIWLVNAGGSSGVLNVGFSGGKKIPLLHRYNIADDEWPHYMVPASSGLPNNATYRPLDMASFQDDEYLYLANGNTAAYEFRRYTIEDRSGTPDRDELDPGPGSWTALPDTRLPKNGPLLTAIDNGVERVLYLARGNFANDFFKYDFNAQHKATLYSSYRTGVQATLAHWTAITDGSFRITIDGTQHDITGIDYSGATSMDDVASITETAIRNVTASTEEVRWCGSLFATNAAPAGQFLFRSPTAPGGGGTISVMSSPGTGTYLGTSTYMGTDSGSGILKGESTTTGDWLDCDEAGAPPNLPTPMGFTSSGSDSGGMTYDPVLDELWIADADGDHGNGFFLNPHKGLLWRYDISTEDWLSQEPAANTPATIRSGADLTVHDTNTLYLTRGNNTGDFWSYDISSNIWDTGLSDLPNTLTDGGTLISDGSNTLYATRGNNTNEFYSYNIGTDTWTDLTSTDPVPVNLGSTSTQNTSTSFEILNDSLWLMVGKGFLDTGEATGDFLYRYDTLAGEWPIVPGVVENPDTLLGFNEGTDLAAANGTDLYAVAGTENNTNNFWHYDLLTDTWTALANFGDTPETPGQKTADDGTSLASFMDKAIYALRGQNTNDFYRYDIAGNSWSQDTFQDFPVNVGSTSAQDIADMVFSTTVGNFYAFPGSGSVIYTLDGTDRVYPAEINGGTNPTVNVPFDIVVRAIDINNDPVNVPADRDITLTLETGTGNLGGTLSGTILGGQSEATISGVTYDVAESGIVIRATDVSTVPTLDSEISDPFTVNPPPPDIVSIDTPTGSTAGGTEVTITGTDFLDGARVTFDGYDSDQVVFNSPTELVATTPPHTLGTVDITVINPSGQSDTLSSAYTFAAPTVTNTNPPTGSTTGGTAVTITGTNIGPSQYRVPVTITNGGGGALTDYQVSFDIDTASLISAGKMRGDCGDLRLRDSDEITRLPYWIEDGSCNTATTRVWTKISSLPTGDTDIYVTYGNLNLTSESNGEEIFVFFDDFSGSSVDTNKWGGATGQFSVGGGILENTGTNNDRLSSIEAFTGDYILETKHRTNGATAGNGYQPSGFFEATNNSAGYLNLGGTDFYREDTGFISLGSDVIPSDTDLRYVTSMHGTTVDLSLINYATGAVINSVSDNDNGLINENIAFGQRYDNGIYTQSYDGDWDWTFIREYTATEPTTALGVETGAALQVEFDNLAASNIAFVNNTTVTAETPPHALGFVDVDVLNFDGILGGSTGTLEGTQTNGFEYRTPPDLISITPDTGINNQTYNVQFDGTDFVSGITGRLEKTGESDILCTSVNFVNSTQFTCDLDLNSVATGTWDVVVENPDGLTDTLVDGFTITLAPPDIVSVTPDNGPVAGGTNVTINGTNFISSGYIIPVTINNGGGAETDYQVSFQVDTATPIDAAKMNADCSDIRVLDSNLSELTYWIDGPCDTDNTVIWAVVPSVPSGNKDIYITYGNPALADASDLAGTFPALADANNQIWLKGNSITPGTSNPVTFDQTINVTTTDNDVEKTSGGSSWNAGFSTNESFTGDGIITFQAGTTGTMRSMIGLDADSAITGNYVDLDFALYANNGTFTVYESGIARGNFGFYTSSDILSVESKDGTVVYRKNGEELYVSGVAPSATLYGEGSFFDQGTIVNDIQMCSGDCNYGSVTSWNDQSGNGNNATVIPDNAPAYVQDSVNGLPTLLFDGSEDYLEISNGDIFRNVPGISMFAVAQSDTTAANTNIFFISTASPTVTRASLIRNNTAFLLGGRRLDADVFQSLTGGTVNTGTYTFESGILDYANSDAFLYSNGSLLDSSTTFQTDGNTEDTASADIWIGAAASNPVFNGNMAEIITFNDAVTTAERQEIERYLDNKYQITGTTPSTSVGSESPNIPTVTFDGLECTNLNYVNSTELTCDTPAHALGSVDVTVTNPDTQSDTLVNGFTYVGDPDETVSTFTAASPTTIADGATTNILTATVTDSASGAISGQAVTVAQTGGSGLTSIRAVNCSQADIGIVPKGTSNANGEACFAIHSDDITSPSANTYTATITSIPADITQTADVEFIADYPDMDDSTFTSAPGTVLADGSTPSTLTATIVDSLGRFIVGQTISVTDDSGGVTYSPVSAEEDTNASGVADFDVTSTTAGTVTFTANMDSTYYDKTSYTEEASPTFINDYEGTASTLIAGSQGDDVEATTTLPFDFELFGTNVPASTTIYVCSNGFISLASSGCPSSGALQNAIAGFFRDLDTTSGGVYREVASDNNSVRFLWDAQDVGSSNPVLFEMVLRRNNQVEFHYFENSSLTARIGIYDSTASSAPDEISTYDNSIFGDSEATRLYNPPTGPVTPGVTQQPQVEFTAGTVVPGNSTVEASPTTVVADGVEISTVTVTLRDGFNNPVPGRTVELSDDQTSGQVEYVGYPAPPPYPTDVTDANGQAIFDVRSTAVDTVEFTANDITGATTFIGTTQVEFTCIVGPNQQCVQVTLVPNPGVLTVTAPDDFAFPPIISSTSSQEAFSIDSTTPYTLNVNDIAVVTDTQNAGGFNLQMQASVFEDSGTLEQIPLSGFYAVTQASNTGGTQISGVEYDSGYAGVTNITAAQNNDTAGNLDSATTFTTNGDNLDSVIDLMLAPVTTAEVGRDGQFKQNVQYYLQIPAFQQSGSYAVTLTFDLTRTPAI